RQLKPTFALATALPLATLPLLQLRNKAHPHTLGCISSATTQATLLPASFPQVRILINLQDHYKLYRPHQSVGFVAGTKREHKPKIQVMLEWLWNKRYVVV